jgi:hypothetical protein
VLLLTVLPPHTLTAQDTVLAGYGSLRRDQILIRFAAQEVELHVLPLDEQVIRLLAPDTYRSLRALLDSRRGEIDRAASRAGTRAPTLVLVTFFGVVSAARFAPEHVSILSRGRLYRPLGIVPLGPGWNRLQLDARQQAVAIYLFDEGISFREPVTVTYQQVANDSWAGAIAVLDRERARVSARARVERSP